jgi:hypothetical protein
MNTGPQFAARPFFASIEALVFVNVEPSVVDKPYVGRTDRPLAEDRIRPAANSLMIDRVQGGKQFSGLSDSNFS